VQRRNKRLPPVAQAFRDFLLSEGSALVDRFVPVVSPTPQPRSTRRAAAVRPSTRVASSPRATRPR